LEDRGRSVLSVTGLGGDSDLVGRSGLETNDGVAGVSDVVDGNESSVGSLVLEGERHVSESSRNVPGNTSNGLLSRALIADVGDGKEGFDSGGGRDGHSGHGTWGVRGEDNKSNTH